VGTHLQTLWGRIDWFNPRTLRKFYAELRPHGNQLGLEMKRSAARFEAEGAKAGRDFFGAAKIQGAGS